jgi:hypothetical protein
MTLAWVLSVLLVLPTDEHCPEEIVRHNLKAIPSEQYLYELWGDHCREYQISVTDSDHATIRLAWWSCYNSWLSLLKGSGLRTGSPRGGSACEC